MRSNFLVIFVILSALSSGWVAAQTPVATPAQSQTTTDPAKIADLEKRFNQGQQSEQEGKLPEARAIYDGILAEEPNAKASLREAGFISVQLNELEKANDYFGKLHALVPDYPLAIEALIQINETLKRDVKVELLLKEFRGLYAAGKLPNKYFVRERIHLDPGAEIAMTEFFDYKQPPYSVWSAQMFDSNGQLKRQLDLVYDPNATKDLRAKDPKMANAEQFLLVEEIIKNGQITRVDVYGQFLALPEYTKIRNTMLTILAGSVKPIYSQTVDAHAPSQSQ